MQGLSATDPDMVIDWGKTSRDYARHRPPPPPSFFNKLQALGIGLDGQSILDLATGTGIIARQMARQGCIVTAGDISETQVKMAQSLATDEGLSIDFFVSPAEDITFAENSFDCVTVNQAFLYFDTQKVISLIKHVLRPKGVLVISHFSWLPLVSKIAHASEQLILKHNPNWTAHSYDGTTAPAYPGLEHDFHYKAYFYYDEEIAFTRADWRGRMRACRGVGAALTAEQVEAYDQEHERLLQNIAPENFTIPHRIDAHILAVN